MKKRVISYIDKIVLSLDILLAVLTLIGVIVSMADVFKYLGMILGASPAESFHIVQKLLSHVLLLVIGLEFVSLLIKHNPSDIVQILLLAIARKLLIESKSMIDILIATVAIACILAIKKLFLTEYKQELQQHSKGCTNEIQGIKKREQ